jgi:murein DD-endopeptidase MepM/ murein hydrolase activator NlpD
MSRATTPPTAPLSARNVKTTAVLLAAVTLSCVVGTGDASASGAAAETLTSPATTATATVAGEVSAAEVAAAKRSARGRRAATTRSVVPKTSGGVTADQTTSAIQGTPTVPDEVPNPPARVRAKVSRFTLSSRTWRTGSAAPKINLRIAASKKTAARVQVRIENTRRRVIARQSLGVVTSGVDITKTVTKRISSQPGSYRLRLVVRDATGRKTQAGARPLRVTVAKAKTSATAPAAPAAPEPAVNGYVFPVQGACNFESLSSQRFHAGRSGGRLHNGHDIGTFSDYPPVVAVTAGTVERIWYDESGGGWTIVFNGDDKIAYGYLHLKPDTITVKAGDRVAAGQPVAHAGKSGGNYDPHLHFEMRPIPWDQNRATAIDPLPLLKKLPNQCTG